MKPSNKDKPNASGGFTLIEVLLSVGILAILAVLAVTSLFYPTHLVVSSGLEQNAINAGNAEIERHLNNYNNPVSRGNFSIDGRSVSVTTNLVILSDPNGVFGGSGGDHADHLKILTLVEYEAGEIINLVTYRSLEIDSSER